MKQEYVSYIREQLHAVLGIDSPSGCTEQVQEYLCGTLRAMGYEPHRLKKGGVHVTLGGEGAPLTLLSHADTLGAVVQYIKPNGRLAISNMTLNVFNAEAENVRVITRFDGAYEGTLQLCNASVHVNPDPYQARDLNKNMEIVLDYDVKTAEDVKKMGIRPGDAIALEPRLRLKLSQHFQLIVDKIIGYFLRGKSAPARLVRRLIIAVEVDSAAAHRAVGIANIALLRGFSAPVQRNLLAEVRVKILACHGGHARTAQ